MPVEEIDSCDPVKTNKELGLKYAYDGVTELIPDAAAYPCGLVAKSLFNDTLELFEIDPMTGYRYSNNPILVHDEKIAWPTDIKHKFHNLNRDDWASV